jgi:hypothetical protein
MEVAAPDFIPITTDATLPAPVARATPAWVSFLLGVRAGFAVRTDMLGVTSIVRALNLDARCYNTLLDCFHSSAVKLDRLTALWTQVVLRENQIEKQQIGRCPTSSP